MANKNKATHNGTCQACGNMQKLPGGVLSKHGYDVKWNFFNGVCIGAGYKPFEQATDLIERCIKNAQGNLVAVRAQIAALDVPATEPKCWVKHYPKAGYGISGKPYWVEVGIYEREVTYTSGTFTEFYTWRDGVKVERYRNYDYDNNTALGMATKANKYFIEQELAPRASQLAQYIKWQQERVANWQPQELKPVEAK